MNHTVVDLVGLMDWDTGRQAGELSNVQEREELAQMFIISNSEKTCL